MNSLSSQQILYINSLIDRQDLAASSKNELYRKSVQAAVESRMSNGFSFSQATQSVIADFSLNSTSPSKSSSTLTPTRWTVLAFSALVLLLLGLKVCSTNSEDKQPIKKAQKIQPVKEITPISTYQIQTSSQKPPHQLPAIMLRVSP